MANLDYLEIGSVPGDEDCEQLGDDPAKARAECIAYIGQLKRIHGEPPASARLKVRSNPHDFGTYLEVACYYSDEEGAAYAFKCENGPEFWDDAAIDELRLKGFQVGERDRS